MLTSTDTMMFVASAKPSDSRRSDESISEDRRGGATRKMEASRRHRSGGRGLGSISSSLVVDDTPDIASQAPAANLTVSVAGGT